MKYLLYIILLYLFLPFNNWIDLLSILIFFVSYKEDERFALIFAFYTGLIIDLYYPVTLGLNTLLYLILVQALLYVKKYTARNNVVAIGLFTIFYLIKVCISYIIISFSINIMLIISTLLISIPFFLFLNKLIYKKWMKI